MYPHQRLAFHFDVPPSNSSFSLLCPHLTVALHLCTFVWEYLFTLHLSNLTAPVVIISKLSRNLGLSISLVLSPSLGIRPAKHRPCRHSPDHPKIKGGALSHFLKLLNSQSQESENVPLTLCNSTFAMSKKFSKMYHYLFSIIKMVLQIEIEATIRRGIGWAVL